MYSRTVWKSRWRNGIRTSDLRSGGSGLNSRKFHAPVTNQPQSPSSLGVDEMAPASSGKLIYRPFVCLLSTRSTLYINSNFNIEQSGSVLLNNILPSRFMFIRRHLRNRHAWHWFLRAASTTHRPSALHTYCMLRLTLLLKKPRQPSQLGTP